jgi:hypothetical protein
MIFGREEEEEDQPIVAGKAALLLDEEDEAAVESMRHSGQLRVLSSQYGSLLESR